MPPARPALRRVLAARLAGGPLSVDAALAAAREADDLDGLVRRSRADRAALALAFAIARVDAGRPADALAVAASLTPLQAHGAVVDFLAATDAEAPALDAPRYVDRGGASVVFVVSYPRSGSTRALAILEGAFPRSRHAAFPRDGRFFSLKAERADWPGPIFVKDHLLRPEHGRNPVLYLVRDGRDVALSLNDFHIRTELAARREVDPARMASLAAFPARRERFGDWGSHVLAALRAAEAGAPVAFLRYDDLVGADGHAALAGALARFAIALKPAAYATGLAKAEAFEAEVRGKRPEWSRAPLYPEGSLMARWLAAPPAASRWRALLSADDKRALHEAGITDALLAAGFETDPDWWRRRETRR